MRMPGWRVFWKVTLPRAKLSIAAAGLWLALQVGGEITITDMMQARTFAEEIYTQSAVISSAISARFLRSEAGTLVRSNGSSTFSTAESTGMRL